VTVEAKFLPKRHLGATGLELTVLGFGGSMIGNLHRPVEAKDAREALDSGYDRGIRYFDTAPYYGGGIGEHRMGEALRHHRRDSYVISTKVGRLQKPLPAAQNPGPYLERLPFEVVHDYSYDGVMRSHEASLLRLGISSVDIALIHDIDPYNHGAEQPRRFREAMEGAYPALQKLRSEGSLGAIGVGVNNVQVCEDCARAADFDVFLLAGRHTLIEQNALESFLPLCEQRGIGVIVGAPFNSGILARGVGSAGTYNYRAPPEEVRARVENIERICAAHGVSLPAAALQYPLRHPAVVSVLPGIRSAEQAMICTSAIQEKIPDALWRDLVASGLIADPASSHQTRLRA
jgi:D-threo-aldose 1-dehydrogenase